MSIRWVTVVLLALCAGPALGQVEGQPGRWVFVGDGVTLNVTAQEDESLRGTVQREGKTFPIVLRVDENADDERLVGTFESGGRQFNVVIVVEDENANRVSMHTGRAVYRLARQMPDDTGNPLGANAAANDADNPLGGAGDAPVAPGSQPQSPQSPAPRSPQAESPTVSPNPATVPPRSAPPAPAMPSPDEAMAPVDPNAHASAPQGAQAPGAVSSGAGQLVLERRTVRDSTTQLDVGTLLVPRGWNLDANVLWRLDHAMFVTSNSRLTDPQSGVGIVWIPQDTFNAWAYIYNMLVQQGRPPISDGVEYTQRPLDAAEYVQQVAFPRYRKVPGARVVEVKPLPEIAKAVSEVLKPTMDVARQGGINMSFTAARVRYEYPGPGGRLFQEDVYCTIMQSANVQMAEFSRQQGMDMGLSVSFLPERLYSFIAPKGQLDQVTPLLQSIVSSSRTTAKWDAYIAELQRIRQKGAMDRARIMAESRREISEMQQKSWEERMASQDRIHEKFGDAIRGVDRYTDPSGATLNDVTLPAGYKQAWSDGQGNYILSDDPMYRPGQHLQGNWQEMQQKK